MGNSEFSATVLNILGRKKKVNLWIDALKVSLGSEHTHVVFKCMQEAYLAGTKDACARLRAKIWLARSSRNTAQYQLASRCSPTTIAYVWTQLRITMPPLTHENRITWQEISICHLLQVLVKTIMPTSIAFTFRNE